MQTIRDSFFYHLYRVLCAWLSGQWERSRVVSWLTSQKPRTEYTLQEHLPGKILTKLYTVLHLGKLLDGSIFQHPELFAAAALIFAPLIPTLAVFALVCGGFLSMIVVIASGNLRNLTPGTTDRYVLLFAGIYLYATLTSISVSGSLYAGLLTIVFVLFYLVIVHAKMTDRALRWVLIGMIAAGVLVSLYGFYQLMFPSHFRNVWTDVDMFSSIQFRVYSTLENPNVLGEYFLLTIPLAAALLLTEKKRKLQVLYLAACAMMVLCLIFTYSRGCYLGLLAAAAVFLVLLDRRLIFVGIVLLLLSPLYLPESVISRFTSIGNMGDTSTSYRVYIWLGTLAMLKDYWFSGIGPGTDAFNAVYPQYAYNAITAPHSHSLYLQLVCDTGICGLIVFLVLLVSYFRMMFTAISREQNRTAKIFQIGAVSAVAGFLVQSMTDYTFYNYRVLFLFWGLLALSVRFTRMGKSREVTGK